MSLCQHRIVYYNHLHFDCLQNGHWCNRILNEIILWVVFSAKQIETVGMNVEMDMNTAVNEQTELISARTKVFVGPN